MGHPPVTAGGRPARGSVLPPGMATVLVATAGPGSSGRRLAVIWLTAGAYSFTDGVGGLARACKALYTGSIPVAASK